MAFFWALIYKQPVNEDLNTWAEWTTGCNHNLFDKRCIIVCLHCSYSFIKTYIECPTWLHCTVCTYPKYFLGAALLGPVEENCRFKIKKKKIVQKRNVWSESQPIMATSPIHFHNKAWFVETISKDATTKKMWQPYPNSISAMWEMLTSCMPLFFHIFDDW